ncbi:MAG: hypothetical protein EMLJLAPB_00342 [Candidatus Argoarchaeum ethanivorans]|uniref:MotA/TolQ/ExbB proton channel domain-containing protein n=1 Tax=Candidatus Argoarchaeum ethanivorans TaxID=2608793 RepID=A0A811T5X3_9EURY|nr:MAG: hypothetical protein EMLJLAPB_00342 [Candidatus Argoarchaeum ethanivorans]
MFSIASLLQSAIYTVSTSMLYPVMIILLALAAWSILELGGFIFEYRFRHRDLKQLEYGALHARALLQNEDLSGAVQAMRKSGSNYFVQNFIEDIQSCVEFRPELLSVKMQKLIQDCEVTMRKRLEKTKFLTRAGPMFGLMGTLIPMGPALMGLIRGDVVALANNLVIAFGTTVVGLTAGVIGFMVSMVRARWYGQDMSDIEYISEVMFGDAASKSEVKTIASARHNKTDNNDSSDISGVINTNSFRSGRSISCSLFFTATKVIVAKTNSSFFFNPIVFMILIVCINAITIIARYFEIVISFNYLIVINLFICAVLIVTMHLSKMHARKKLDRLMQLHPEDILKDDAYNFEIAYKDIVGVEVMKSWHKHSMKILTRDKWIDIGCVERDSSHNLGILHAILPGRVVKTG